MERKDAIEAELSRPVAQPITEAPEKAPAMDDRPGRASNAYREDFGRHLRGRMPIHNVLSESADADGGYLCPTDFEAEIVAGLEEANVVRSIANVIMTSHERKMEDRVSAALDSRGIFYDQTETWIESEKLYEAVFHAQIEANQKTSANGRSGMAPRRDGYNK